MNLFIGGNGSGKSNILEAIGLLSSALYRGVSDEELSRKGVRITPPALMKSAFKSQKLPKTLRIEAEMSFGVEYALELSSGDKSTHLSFHSESGKSEGKQFLGRSKRGVKILGNTVNRKWAPTRSLWDQARLAYDMPPLAQSEFDELSRFAIFAPQTEFLREVKAGFASDLPVGLHGEGLAVAVLSLIKEFNQRLPRNASLDDRNSQIQVREAISLISLPGWTNEVTVETLDPQLKHREATTLDGKSIVFTDKFMHEKRNNISAYDSSEGTLFLLFMAVLLSHAESPPVFAVDNVDSALNPALTRKLVETIIRIVSRKKEGNFLEVHLRFL